jgi:hypothetical protein
MLLAENLCPYGPIGSFKATCENLIDTTLAAGRLDALYQEKRERTGQAA